MTKRRKIQNEVDVLIPQYKTRRPDPEEAVPGETDAVEDFGGAEYLTEEEWVNDIDKQSQERRDRFKD